MKLLITGGAGFIGSNFIRYLLQNDPAVEIFNLDLLTYAGNLSNLEDLALHPGYHFEQGDIADPIRVGSILKQGIDAIINFAAESHVDRSIANAAAFLHTNIEGTYTLIEEARRYRISRFLQVSTDEVYGSLEHAGRFTESSPYAPNSPYAASKAAADLLIRSFVKTYHFPAMITRASNNFGPYQHPEKMIPLFITHALENLELPIYGDGLHVRDWLFVEDHCHALYLVLYQGKPGEIYNIGGGAERKNIEIAQAILKHLGKPLSLIHHTHDRPGHDRRYALDSSKMANEFGWKPQYHFEPALQKTIDWFVDHRDWWQKCKSHGHQAKDSR